MPYLTLSLTKLMSLETTLTKLSHHFPLISLPFLGWIMGNTSVVDSIRSTSVYWGSKYYISVPSKSISSSSNLLSNVLLNLFSFCFPYLLEFKIYLLVDNKLCSYIFFGEPLSMYITSIFILDEIFSDDYCLFFFIVFHSFLSP